MSAESIQKTTLAWQIRHLGKNVSEWIQLQLSQQDVAPEAPPPPFELPAWIGQLMFWLAISGGVIWVAWVIVQLIDRYRERRGRKVRTRPTISAVPSLTAQTVADWLRQARQFEREGNWREACRALYMAALQLLHDRGWIRHQGSRTDGEYLQEIQTLKQPRPLQLLIRTHERSVFGGLIPTAENWQRCRRAYEEIEKR